MYTDHYRIKFWQVPTRKSWVPLVHSLLFFKNKKWWVPRVPSTNDDKHKWWIQDSSRWLTGISDVNIISMKLNKEIITVNILIALINFLAKSINKHDKKWLLNEESVESVTQNSKYFLILTRIISVSALHPWNRQTWKKLRNLKGHWKDITYKYRSDQSKILVIYMYLITGTVYPR